MDWRNGNGLKKIYKTSNDNESPALVEIERIVNKYQKKGITNYIEINKRKLKENESLFDQTSVALQEHRQREDDLSYFGKAVKLHDIHKEYRLTDGPLNPFNYYKTVIQTAREGTSINEALLQERNGSFRTTPYSCLSRFEKPNALTTPVCFICYSKYDNQQEVIVLECCLSAIADERVDARKMDGFMEHGRYYCDAFNCATFKIVMKQGRKQTTTLHLSGSYEDVVFPVLNEKDLMAVVKVYTELEMHLLTSFEVVIPKHMWSYHQNDGSFPALNETRDVVRKDACQSTDVVVNNRTSHESTFKKPDMGTTAEKICFICYLKSDNQQGVIVLECCLSAIADKRVDAHKMDGFIEHGRHYCDAFNGAKFKIVMKQGREQTATLDFSGSYDLVVFSTLDEDDPKSVIKVYTELEMNLLISFEVVSPKDQLAYQHNNVAENKKTCMDIECFRKNKSTNETLVIPVVMKYRKACVMCFSINDLQRSEVVLEFCSSQMAPERIEQRISGGYSTHGQIDVMACLGETFKIVMQDESEHIAEIHFAEPYQEIDLQVKSFTQTLVTVVVYKCEQYAPQIIKRFSVDRRGHLLDFQENINSERGKLTKTHDAVNRDGKTKDIQSTDDATNVRASNRALSHGLLSSSGQKRRDSCVKLCHEELHAFSNKYNFSARSFAMWKSQKETYAKLRNRKKRSPKTSRLKRKASSTYKRCDSHMSSSSTMYVSSTKKKRATHDWLQHASFNIKRSRHQTRILSKKCVEKKDILMNTMERPCEELPESYKKLHHPPAPSIQVDYVRNDANMFEVYSYVRRRIDEAIELCRDDISSSDFCSENIWIIFSDDQSTSGNNFYEGFTDIQRGSIESILDKDPCVIVSIGMNEQCFATLLQKSADKPMSPVICQITPTSPTDIKCKDIHRNMWGFECFAKDLSKDNVVAYVDKVLEYYAFEVLDRATKNLPESGEITSRVIAQVQSFHEKYMPMPEILKRENSGKKITKMEKISKQVLALPQVFACDISESTLRVMILKNDETGREEVTNRIKMMGLSDEDFFLQIVDIQPLAKMESGSQVYARGSPGKGTLGGFAKFTSKHTTHDVAITAKHVVDVFEPLTLCVNNQTIGPVLEDKITYDISIVRVTADKDKYDTRFRKENKDLCFADLYHENIEALKNKAVHFYGATTGLVRAIISNMTIGTSFKNDYNLITIGKQNKSALAAPGDSGAMILLERDPRCPEKNMYALGTLVGEYLPREEKGAQKSADTSRAKLPVKNETENTVQLTKKTTFSGKPMHTENTKQFFTPSAHTKSFQNTVPSEDQFQTTIPTHADDTRHPENPMTLEDPTNSENQSSTKDKMSSECSLPLNDDTSRHGSIPSSNTHKTYLIVPLKTAFDQLSKKHGGIFSLFTK